MKKNYTYNMVILDDAVRRACFMAYPDHDTDYVPQCLYEEIKYSVLDHLWNTETPLYKWRLRKIENVIHEQNKARPDDQIDAHEFMENIAFGYQIICYDNEIEYDWALIHHIASGYRNNMGSPIFKFTEHDIEQAA